MTQHTVLRAITGWRRVAVVGALVVGAVVGTAVWRRDSVDPALVAPVRRGALTATLTTSGTLRPIASITYRSPVPGREVEIKELAPEGTHISAGDLLIRLDTTELEREFDRAQQDHRQVQLEVQAAEGEWEEAGADVKAVSEGEGALAVEEARIGLQRAQKKVDRLRQDLDRLKPLLDKGFMTRDELAKTSDALEQAEEELEIARKRTNVVVQMTHPREEKRAAVLLAQTASKLGHARTRLHETELRQAAFRQVIEACSLYARGPGLVVYEEFLTANPRRKIRVGDRVYATQGIVTIPEVNRMQVEASVGEAEVHRVHPGQPVNVRVEAFPDLRLTGTVSRVGALASGSINRPFDDKRFDLVIDLNPTTADLRPEMTVRADVVVGTRQDVLLVPVTAVFERQGVFVSYVVGAGGPEARPVQPGESNDRQVEVAAGLNEGERVMLVEPASAMADKSAPAVGVAPRGNVLQPR